MAYEVRINRPGGSEVLEICDIRRADIAPDEAWIVQESIGINYLDVTQRSGAVPIPIPGGIGIEAAGRVAAVGNNVSNVQKGDRVAYVLGPLGAYSSERAYPANRLIPIPDLLSFDDAAAVTCKGITAQYLLKSTYPVGHGSIVLIYGVAGALGQFMVPWAKHLGAYVIGVVSKETSIEVASGRGCDDILVWDACDLPTEVDAITDGRKVDVVYDGIGKDTFEASLGCLRARGTMVSIGASSGTPLAVEIGTLNSKGSLFLTRPSLAAHATELSEYHERAADVYAAVQAGIISPKTWKAYPLKQVTEAHEALESGITNGPVIAKP